ncbi:MAG: aspartate aminotransferase family protein, partial [Desulfovibrionaceae bacterium]|nr:aspartate aminotransferase family protein [Desulfovibrionaceae bacterium]
MVTPFESLKQRDAAFICHTYGRYPLDVARAKGSRVWSSDGREYIDLLTGIAVTGLGHCNDEVTEVIREQAGKLVHTCNLVYQKEQIDLAEKLLSTAHFGKVFFCNSGAEANEAAIKIARRYMQKVRKTDATDIITLKNAFHGRTLGTVAATGQPAYQDGFAPMPGGFVQVPWGDLKALEAAITPRTVGVLAEIVQGESGILPMPAEYAKGIEALCRAKGILFIVDEVQAGMCRSGRFWSFQRFGLKPDVISCAKAIANGLPMGAMMATDEVAQAFEPGTHGTTFGGNALISAVACKVIDIMRRDKLDERADRVGEACRARLRAVAERHPGAVAEVRGMGLLIGIELTGH